MKKGLKAFSSLLIAILVAIQIVPAVGAQENDARTILQEINQTNNEVISMRGEGFLSLSMVSNEQRADLGQLNFDFAYNIDPKFALDAKAEVVSPFIGEALNLGVFYDNGVAYLFDGTAWEARDFSAEEQAISDAFSEAMGEITNGPDSEEAQAMLDINVKYTDLEVTDTEYIFSLKENINAEELWADLNNVVDLEALKDEAIAQAEAEAGEAIDQASLDTIESMYSAETLDAILKTNPVVDVHYDKETLRVTNFTFEFNINLADFIPEEDLVDEEGNSTASQLPQLIIVAGEINFSNFGEQFDISVPQEAIDSLIPEESVEESSQE
ncbi:hypothetical protein [Fundicoccus culcitae]|uniref:Uncharacterized protein n=1 Tax=Fundicoccus culcitae TaxID=2969821 RepID=A0ABY5P2K2_9LACT|nr:hypothetical protein [Fundicoccus culcitae]UUX32947.1 hypothetical protein NRE15_08445 [Fundicoccus culcitae]